MQQPRPTRALVDLERRAIVCPKCEQEQPMRDFAILGMNPLYADQLTPIYRCVSCGHLFAPRLLGEAPGHPAPDPATEPGGVRPPPAHLERGERSERERRDA